MKALANTPVAGSRAVYVFMMLLVVGVFGGTGLGLAPTDRAEALRSQRSGVAAGDTFNLIRRRNLTSAARGWAHAPKAAVAPCLCERSRDSYPEYPHFAEVEVVLDETRTVERLKTLPCAPGSRLEVLDGGQRVKAQWYATAVGDLIDEGADVTVLRDFVLSQKPVRSVASAPRGISAAQTCSGSYRQGSNTTNYSTVYYDWTWSDIQVTGAPSNAVVTCVDVHYEIVYPYAGDLSVTVSDEDLTYEYTLLDNPDDTTVNPSATVTGITDFAGEGVNQWWTLWAFDWYELDDGYIDSWWIKVYYTVPTPAPANDDCANAVTLSDGVSYQGTTYGATGTYDTWCGFYDRLDTWHVFTATRTGMTTISAASAEFDATLGVFSSCGGTELACSDDRCTDDPDPQIMMPMTAGVTYYIRVAGYDYRTGDYTLTVTQAPQDLPDTPSQPSPADGATGTASRRLLSWNDSAGLVSTARSRFSPGKKGRTDEPTPKIIYGADDRVEQYEVGNINYRAAGDATVIIVYWSDLVNNGNGTYTLPSETFAYWYEQLDPLGTGNPLCADERFRNQPAPGVCSGVLVSPDLIATAGHCVACTNISDLAVVFGFVMQDASNARLTVSANDVYRCSEVVAYTDGYPDWSLVRLDREVAGHTPLPLRRTGQVSAGEDLLVVGHPWGLPRKYDMGATVRDNSPSTFFQANADTYIGSSGSPVINRTTLEVEGLVTAGMESFVVDDSLTCDRSRVCPDSGCPGWEDISRVTTFSSLVPTFDVYLGTTAGSMSLVSSHQVVPWYNTGALETNTTYYWRVVARNAWGTTQGPTWSFTTGSTPPYSPMYRFWSPRYGRHFYTISADVRDYVIDLYDDYTWTYEGPVYNAFPTDSEPGLQPVYRFWSDTLVSHFYTISVSERDYVINTWPDTWTYEGEVFYAYPPGSQPAGTKPVYRFWSDVLETHFYTISEAEKAYVEATWPDAWTYEGIAWYAYE